MTTEELETRIRAAGLTISILGTIDAFTLCKTLDCSRRTLGIMIETGQAPPHVKRTRKLRFPVDELAAWITKHYE